MYPDHPNQAKRDMRKSKILFGITGRKKKKEGEYVKIEGV